MRAPIYRNLDQPLQVLGLRPLQIVLAGSVLVVGGEMARTLGWPPTWPFFTFILFVGFVFALNRRLGPEFLSRLFRFLFLPSGLSRKVLSRRRWV